MRRFILLACISVLPLLHHDQARAATSGSAKNALNAVLPELRFDNVTVDSAIDFLRDASGANIHVNWRAIEESGIDKNTTINVRLRSVPLRKVLQLVLSEAGHGTALTYYIDDNVIEVTTRELSDKQMLTRVYPVEDLIMDIPDFEAPNFNIGSGSSGGRGSSGGGNIISGSVNTNQGNQNTRDQRAQNLIDTIQAVVQPEIWSANGGPAAIRFFNGSLIVTAPRSVHEALSSTFD